MGDTSSVTSSDEDFFDCHERVSDDEVGGGEIVSDDSTGEEGEAYELAAEMAKYEPDASPESRFEKAEAVILKWQGSISSPWNSPADAEEYLSAVKQLVLLKYDWLLISRREVLLSIAEPRLKQRFNDGLLNLINDDSAEFLIKLREVDELMVGSGFNTDDCFQIYETCRLNYLKDRCPLKNSSEDDSLDCRTTKWLETVKNMTDLLIREKEMFQAVFSVESLFCYRARRSRCTEAIFSGYLTGVLDNGAALVKALMRIKSPQKLVWIRDMYQAWYSVPRTLGDLYCKMFYLFILRLGNEQFPDNHVVGQASLFLLLLEDTYLKLSESRLGFPDVDIHPSVISMMTNAVQISNEDKTLSTLQNVLRREESIAPQDDAVEVDSDPGDGVSQRVNQLRDFMSSLESNLVDKSKEFKDPAMRCIFLMNNIRYIVQQVKSSILENLLSETWVRRLIEKEGKYALRYFRACWPKVLSALQDVEGSPNNWSKLGKFILKQSLKSFNKQFEGIYRKQTGWKVPEAELREDLQRLITQNVIQKYRNYVGTYQRRIEDNRAVRKCFKYSEEDLQRYLQDLFQGMPRKLPVKRPKCAAHAMPQWNCFNQGLAVN